MDPSSLIGSPLFLLVVQGVQDTAQTIKTTSAEGILAQVGSVLLIFLVMSVVFEVALTPVFNWRVFLARFEGKGVKTPTVIILAFFVFWRYDLDIVRDLLVALGYEAELSFGGQFLTALLIAGGSDGVLRVFTRLGIRDPKSRAEKAKAAQAAVAGPTP